MRADAWPPRIVGRNPILEEHPQTAPGGVGGGTTGPARRQRRHRLPHARGLQREAGTHERQAGRARTEDVAAPNGPTISLLPA